MIRRFGGPAVGRLVMLAISAGLEVLLGSRPFGRGPMVRRRSSLLTISALGAIISSVGGAGLFAALTDTATTGANSVDSAPLAGSADIQLASATVESGQVSCGTFSEDLVTAFFTAANVTAGYRESTQFCIKSVGSQAVSLTVLADQLVDVDFDCTGDEAALGDTTCGADQLGELSSVLVVGFSILDCSTASGTGPASTLASAASTPLGLGTLSAGATGCFGAVVSYLGTTASDAQQEVQSDRSTWRFRFDAAS